MFDDPSRSSDRTPRRRRIHRSKAVLLMGRLAASTADDLCLVSDISTVGARVQTAQQLAEGDRVTLEMGDMPPIACRVCWVAGGTAGLEFDHPIDLAPLFVQAGAEPLSDQPANDDSRASRRGLPRVRRCAHVQLYHRGRDIAGELVDVSPGGTCVALTGEDRLEPNNWVAISIAGMPEREATVRWVDGVRAGLSFDCPLSLWKLDKWLIAEIEKCSTCTASHCPAPSFQRSPQKHSA